MKTRLFVVKWSVCAAVFGIAAAMIARPLPQAQTRQPTFGISLPKSAENLKADWHALLGSMQKSTGLTAPTALAAE
jgi:hypothetical protein